MADAIRDKIKRYCPEEPAPRFPVLHPTDSNGFHDFMKMIGRDNDKYYPVVTLHVESAFVMPTDTEFDPATFFTQM